MIEPFLHRLQIGRVPRQWLVLLTTLCIFLPLGCTEKGKETLLPPVDLAWPSDGSRPGIVYRGCISGPEDLQITENILAQLWAFVVGRRDPPMVHPFGITVDSGGRIFTADSFQRKIHLFDAAAGVYRLLPEDESELLSPIGVAVNEERGLLYIADSAQATVLVFDETAAQPVESIGQGLLQRPTGMAVNRITGELLVVDTGHACVFRFNLRDHSLLGRFGGPGDSPGAFNRPTAIGVARDGSILITDALNCRVQVFSPQGEFKRTFGSPGDSPGYFARPRGVASDSDGNIYVVDALFDNVQIFDSQGRLLLAFGSPGREYGEFWLPAGIAIDREDNIYVADSYNHRIQVFHYRKSDGQLP